MRVFLDLDGVVANYTKQACKYLSLEYPKNDEGFKDYLWMEKAVGGIEEYDALVKGEYFWLGIDPYPWAETLIKVVDEASEGNWRFLSKANKDPICVGAKAKWIKKYFPKHYDNLILCRDNKDFHCSSGTDLLIDDSPINVSLWHKKGGVCYFWNEVRYDTDVTERILDIEEDINILK